MVRSTLFFRLQKQEDGILPASFPHVCSPMKSQYYLYYGGSDGYVIRTGLAESRDLYSWKRRQDPVLEPGSEGSWDDRSIIIVSILKLEMLMSLFMKARIVIINCIWFGIFTRWVTMEKV
jgi:hypothetical protein